MSKNGFSNQELIGDLSLLQEEITILKSTVAHQRALIEVYRSLEYTLRYLRVGSPKFNMFDGACVGCGSEYKQRHHNDCIVLGIRRLQRSVRREASRSSV